MLCQQIMKRDVQCLTEKDSTRAAARLMRDKDIGFVPIRDAGGKAIGAITDRDIVVRVAADGASLDAPLEKVMTREVVSCRATDDLARAEQIMAKARKSRIICSDDTGRLVGVISLSDIAQHEDNGRVAKLLCEVSRREAV